MLNRVFSFHRKNEIDDGQVSFNRELAGFPHKHLALLLVLAGISLLDNHLPSSLIASLKDLGICKFLVGTSQVRSNDAQGLHETVINILLIGFQIVNLSMVEMISLI